PTQTEVKATSLTLNTTNTTVQAGALVELTATVLPENTTNKGVTFQSSNPVVATVADNGIVTAVSAGSAVITCQTTDGTNLTATCTVTVNSNTTEKVPDTTVQPEKKVTSITKNNVVYKISGKNTAQCTSVTRSDMKKVTIPSTVKIQGKTYKVTTIAANAFKNKKKLTTVAIGKNVTTIGKNAFAGCIKLSKLALGANVTTVRERAFYKCTALTKVTIPSKVKRIDKQAFARCSKLKSIVIKSSVLKTVQSKVFYGIHKKAVIKVPKKKLSAYKKLLKGKGQAKTVKIKK
ncbi:MAG: leucine-rich repeat protein, partial [Lachnospiraceae bacterium]|nr:leucine-rich repeat protein [Lachnospiraceae bacterium]